MSSSVGKKIAMALSGFFLLLFLLQHMSINMMSVFSEELFNETSHFMGTNPLVQGLLQPILMFGVLFHLGMGIKLELENRAARPVKYAMNNGAANSTWMSRNMIITGITVMLFLGLHLYDFWVHEMQVKYMQGDMSGLIDPMYPDSGYRYWHELHEKFHDPVRVGIYVLSFVFLALHLMHGFQSAFQSVGFNHRKYTPVIKKLSNIYAVAVPLGFIFIAVYHFMTQS
ncbi:MAG: succinate dehydrogenase cytochrome b subunit [Bacteroidetes bacterium]|nr:MAG: succinate dehydrogenase cytochrome b subunit [Bacteroidota bacterium]